MHSSGLRRFRGAVTLLLVCCVRGCAPVRCKVFLQPGFSFSEKAFTGYHALWPLFTGWQRAADCAALTLRPGCAQVRCKARHSPILPSGRAQARSRRLFFLRLVGFSAHYGGGLQKLRHCSGLPLPKFSALDAVRLKIWTAAPAPPRLFLPQAAPRLRSQIQPPVLQHSLVRFVL